MSAGWRTNRCSPHPMTNRNFFSELAWAQEVAGQHADAQESWRTGRAELEPLLEGQPDNYFIMNELALTETGPGNKAAALDLAQRAIAVVPTENDAFQGPGMMENLARVAAQVGEPDQAIALLQKAAPNSIRRSAQWRTDASH
jgi:predicted Zn-dependent protease